MSNPFTSSPLLLAGPFRDRLSAVAAACNASRYRTTYLYEQPEGCFNVWDRATPHAGVFLLKYHKGCVQLPEQPDSLIASLLFRQTGGGASVGMRVANIHSLAHAKSYGQSRAAFISVEEGVEMYLCTVIVSNGSFENIPAPDYYAEGVEILSVERTGLRNAKPSDETGTDETQ